MPNEKNLEKGIATQFRSGEEAARNGKKGGIASGKARKAKQRRYKNWEEMADLFLPMAVNEGKLTKIKSLSDLDKKNHPNITVEETIFFALLNKAMKGDVSAIRELFEMTSWNKTPTNEQTDDTTGNGFIKALEGKASEAWDDEED